MTGLTGNLPPLSVEGNLCQNWNEWIQDFNIYMTASGYDSLKEFRKVSIFLHFIGKPALKIFNSFNQDIKTVTLETVISCFADYFIPRKNVTIERHKFFTRLQSADENISEYVADLKNLSMSCEFDTLRESLVKDVLIFGLHNNWQQLKQHLLREDELSLDKALKICSSMELSKHRTEQLNNPSEEVLTVQTTKVSSSRSRKNSQSKSKWSSQRNTSQKRELSSAQKRNNNGKYVSSKSNNCTRCGQIHKFKCPAFGVQCNNCKNYNHFAKFCKSKSVKVVSIESNNESETDQLFVGTVYTISNNSSQTWQIDLYINNIPISCLLDTGAQANIMSLHNLLKLKVSEASIIKKNTTKLMSIHSIDIPTLGTCSLRCCYKNSIEVITFFIVDFDCITVLGLASCQQLNLLQRVNVVNNNSSHSVLKYYNDIFEGLGCLPIKCHIHINNEVEPIIDAPRKIPFALYEQLRKELDNMCYLKVIERIASPTSWVSSIVIVKKKNNKLRICLDPRNLNRAISRSHYPLPTFEAVKTQLSGTKFFSTLDANSGFWMIPLDEKSSELCTFNTPFGRYKFLRLPYGLNCAPEIFHRIITELFSDIVGVIVYIDDLIITGTTLEEHNQRLKKVLDRAREVNLKFNKSKCIIGVTEVKFLGHVFNSEGVKPDPDKIKAIVNMPSPKSVKDLQRFLGMINYLSSYIPKLADETTLLRSLLKKNTSWVWDENYESMFNKVKNSITTAPVLSYYDPSIPLTLSVDASQFAVGAVILQNDKPCAYASQTLTSAQQNYAQIEKELYAIVFGCKRFHQYLYGQVVKVQTDHKPLVSLFKKALHSVPTRLQRMMLNIQSYHLNVEYVPGKLMVLADTLSRAPLPDSDEDNIDEELILQVQVFSENLAIGKQYLDKIKNETLNDSILQKIKNICKSGWPLNKSLLENSLKPFWTFRDEIHVIDDLVFKGNCLVVPTKLRSDMLKLIHEGHMGIERCRNQIKDVLFWPGISNDIKNIVESCEVCLKYRNNNAKEPMISHAVPDLPWQKLGIDLFHHNDKTYLLVVDYYSKFIEIAHLSKGSHAKLVITQLKSIFARFGIPMEIISDNGPPFNAAEFKLFCSDWGINIVTSSPNYPQSNGLAERCVQIVKKLLKKSSDTGTDPYIALMQYRNTANNSLCSPAQLLMSRNLRTKIPIKLSSLKPKLVEVENHNKQISTKTDKVMSHYNKNTKQLSQLKQNDKILFKIKPNSTWSNGKIVEVCAQPRSYRVEADNGKIYRRNRKFIIKSALKSENKNKNEKSIEINLQAETKNRFGRNIVKPKRFLN
ncbi:unnamed protein product [Macrosiphum euphorbiae]|uniref:RNA-directed DNA polymerase n=1 Tax=Macrosiphum euphorbiae TaxID=13131 RepID=A0AAV0X8T2_9HEMI|nr:unnamed protein product [Macrosiphum euphorbiae]